MKGEIPKEIFDILACPLCKSDLVYTKGKKNLVCAKCKRKFPIKEGVPILLPENTIRGKN